VIEDEEVETDEPDTAPANDAAEWAVTA
jgi:hypothetical protein